jgi:hypothetical protein
MYIVHPPELLAAVHDAVYAFCVWLGAELLHQCVRSLAALSQLLRPWLWAPAEPAGQASVRLPVKTTVSVLQLQCRVEVLLAGDYLLCAVFIAVAHDSRNSHACGLWCVAGMQAMAGQLVCTPSLVTSFGNYCLQKT